MIKSFNVQLVIDTDASNATIVIPKGMEQYMGGENVLNTLHDLVSESLYRNRNGNLVNTNSISLNVLRTCCGCEVRTFHNPHTDTCIICGRTNHP